MVDSKSSDVPPAVTERKKSVRLVSPPRSSAEAVPPFLSDGNGSPAPESSPLLSANTFDEHGAGDASMAARDQGRQPASRRSPSPYDPAGPRPSQRNRDEERMFAEMHGVDPEDESFQEQEAGDVSDRLEFEAAGQAGKSETDDTDMSAM